MDRNKVIDNIHLSTKFTGLVTIVIVATVSVYLIWSVHMQRSASQDKVLAEARTLSIQMAAVWDYINDSQATINYNSDGSYDFKGIYCSIAGKNIAQRFTLQSGGYIIRYARENPRSSTDEPDEFEKRAITLFSNKKTREHYGLEKYKDKMVFR